jgi:hypothetical protein
MGNSSLHTCALDVRDIGYKIRMNNKDGLAGWQSLKAKYTKCTFNGIFVPTTLSIKQSFKDLVQNVQYTVPAGDTDHASPTIKIGNELLSNQKPEQHFLIQLFRIPVMGNYLLPIVKIMQIAYNLGQFQACVNQKKYTQEIVDFYRNNRLFDLNTFIDSEYLDMGVSCP